MKQAFTRKRSRLWFDIHSWMGLKLSLFMSFVLITGTFAVISSELDWLTHSSMRVAPQPATERATWGDIYESLREAYPDWQFSYVREPVDPWFTVLAYGKTPDGDTRLVDVNPYTAEVQGDRNWMSFQRFFRNTHRHLMLPTRIGVPIVSALAFVLIASMVTGLVVYKKFWRGFFKKPRRRNARIFNGDLHRLLGLWSFWFLPLIALTSVFYFAESLGWRAPPFGKPEKAAEIKSNLTAEQVNRHAQGALEALPGLHIAVVLPPTGPGDSLVFQGYTDDTWLVRPRASYVAIDPLDGRVLGTHRSKNSDLHQRISEMADPLHFGYFGGIITKLIWFAFGAMLSALAVTGLIIYAKRLHKSYLSSDFDQQTAGSWTISWKGMGHWKWIGVLAIITVMVLTPIEAGL